MPGFICKILFCPLKIFILSNIGPSASKYSYIMLYVAGHFRFVVQLASVNLSPLYPCCILTTCHVLAPRQLISFYHHLCFQS